MPEIVDVCTENLTRLASTSRAIGESTSGTAARQWQTPEQGSWSGRHSDVAGLVGPFDRTDANEGYSGAILQASGTVADMICQGTQIGYVGAMERAYRARHASPVRCLVHSAARRRGHGDDAGVLLCGPIAHLQRVIEAGAEA
jgi:hypothetical protein